MVTREDHGLVDDAPSTALVVFALFLFLLDEHEMAEDVEEAVALQHFLPEIAGAVARGVLRVASAALHLAWVAASVEGEEARAFTVEARAHVYFVWIGGEVDQRPRLEAEQWCAWVAVRLVLPYGLPPALARAGIF